VKEKEKKKRIKRKTEATMKTWATISWICDGGGVGGGASASTSNIQGSSNDKQAETFLRFCRAEPCILAWADD